VTIPTRGTGSSGPSVVRPRGTRPDSAAGRSLPAGSISAMTASNDSVTSTQLTASGARARTITQVSVLLYSDDFTTRDAVRAAVGRRPSKDVEVVRWHECATADAVISTVDHERFDILVLDGEAAKVGGLGLARQLKNEIFDCPPIIVLTGRPQDSWLAAWSQADLAVPHPLDPIALTSAITTLARAGVHPA
jgi:CheY-like chemotaxis protein